MSDAVLMHLLVPCRQQLPDLLAGDASSLPSSASLPMSRSSGEHSLLSSPGQQWLLRPLSPLLLSPQPIVLPSRSSSTLPSTRIQQDRDGSAPVLPRDAPAAAPAAARTSAAPRQEHSQSAAAAPAGAQAPNPFAAARQHPFSEEAMSPKRPLGAAARPPKSPGRRLRRAASESSASVRQGVLHMQRSSQSDNLTAWKASAWCIDLQGGGGLGVIHSMASISSVRLGALFPGSCSR